jgi:hypothetical protein
MKSIAFSVVFLTFVVAASSQTKKEVVAWTVALEDNIPTAVPKTPSRRVNSLEFLLRFTTVGKPSYVLLYDSIKFTLEDEGGNRLQEPEAVYEQPIGIPPNRSDILSLEPGQTVSSIWRIVKKGKDLYIRDRAGGVLICRGIKTGKYRLKVAYHYPEEFGNPLLIDLLKEVPDYESEVFRESMELGVIEFLVSS